MNRAMRFSIVAVAIMFIAGALFPAFVQKVKATSPAPKPINRNPIKTLTGYEFGVQGIAFTPDGKIMAGFDRAVVKMWDVKTGALIRTFNPHKVMIDAVKFSPDGKFIATAGCDEAPKEGECARIGCEDEIREYQCALAPIKFWDVQTGQLLKTLPGHKGETIVRGTRWIESEKREEEVVMFIPTGIYNIDFTPDGKYLASLGIDDHLKIWDVETGQIFKDYTGDKYIEDVKFSPDGKLLATVSGPGIILLDWRTGEKVKQLLGKGGSPIVFSLDGRFIVSTCADQTIKLWDITQEKEIRTFFGHSDNPLTTAISPDNKIVVTGGYDHVIIIHDVETGREIGKLTGHKGAVFDLAFSADGKILYSSGAERYVGGDYIVGAIKYWDATSFSGHAPAPTKVEPTTQAQELVGHDATVQAIAFNPQGKQLVSVSLNAICKLWDLDSRKEIFSIHGDRMGGSYKSVAFSRDGKIIATGAGGVIQLVDAQSGAILNVINKGLQSDVRNIAFSPRGRIFASAGSNFQISIFDIDSAMRLAALDEGIKDGFAANAVAFSPNGAILASAGARVIKLWDVQSEKMILKWEAHPPQIESIAFSPDGTLLASAGWDRVVKLWDVKTGKLVKAMSGHKDYVLSLSFSPDGKTLASGGNDFTVRLWDVASGKTKKILTAERFFVESVAFSPDGKSVAAAIYNNIKIWKL